MYTHTILVDGPPGGGGGGGGSSSLIFMRATTRENILLEKDVVRKMNKIGLIQGTFFNLISVCLMTVFDKKIRKCLSVSSIDIVYVCLSDINAQNGSSANFLI